MAIVDAGLEPSVFYQRLLALADDINELLLAYYAAPHMLETAAKADQSPITAADREAHQLILSRLSTLTPGIPVLSEESAAADIRSRRDWDMAWVVDPLDGTREFIERTGQFTSNIALIIAGKPEVGLITLPVRGYHYLGIVGVGAIRSRPGRGLDGEALRATPVASGAPLRVLASERHNPDRIATLLDSLAEVTGAVTRVNAGSAVKFCHLVEGLGDVYPRSAPCYEWDVAAGDALVTAAGGRVCNYMGESLRYNARPTLLAEPFIAAADPAIDYAALLCDSGAN